MPVRPIVRSFDPVPVPRPDPVRGGARDTGRARQTKSFRVTSAVVAALALTAVTAASPRVAASAGGTPTDGVWRVDGYGQVLVLDGDTAQEYQVTEVSCLPGVSGHRSAAPTGGPGGSVHYAVDGGDGFTVRPGTHGPRPAQASAHFDGSPGVRHLRRLTSLPARCASPSPDTGAVAAFDVFWQTFEENYPFFAAKGVDWRAVRDRYRPTVHDGMPEADLFRTLSDMIAPLDDAHVYLASPDQVFTESRPGTTVPGPDLDARVQAYVERNDLGGLPLTPYANGRIGYADVSGDLGVLRLSGFAGFSDSDTYAANKEAFDKALTAVFTAERTARLRGLIIDVRINGGGSDALGLRLASRLTDRAYTAYAKAARNDPADPTRFTRPQPQRVRPAAAPRFSGPVAVLTGGSTFSAGETFVQALMRRPGRTVRIGENTQGVFSDVLERTLPGGWEFGLPNEEFRTRYGTTFDGDGIPPDLRVPVFTEAEFASGHDSAFRRALAVLPGSGG